MIRLREGIKADAGRLFELDRICFPVGIAYSRREFRWLLGSRRTVCLVAEEDHALAGFVIAQESNIRGSRGGHIITIDVALDFRRRGVGRLLMDEIERRMRAGGAGWLRLEVAVDNSSALSFYSGLGFAGIGRIPDYYHGSIDAVVMEKTFATGRH